MDPDERWQIEATTEFVRSGAYTTVALQFPDELLGDSATVAKRLGGKFSDLSLDVDVFILADSAYDSQSIDEVASSHVNADCIIHYGPASMAPATHTPCFFVFQMEYSSDEKCSVFVQNHLQEWITDKTRAVVVFLDHTLRHWQDAMSARLQEVQSAIPILMTQTPSLAVFPQENDMPGNNSGTLPSEANEGVTYEKVFQASGMQWKLPEGIDMDNCLCIWVGAESSKSLLHLSLQFSKSDWVTLNIKPWRLTVGLPAQTSQILRKRYFLVEKAKSAQLIGILVSTLAVGGFISAVKRILRLAHHAGKKTYLVVIGKPNPEKLANFPEIEVFVMVSDPASMILDSKEFLSPIITPYEAQIAFTGGNMTPNEYHYSMTNEEFSSPADDDTPHFSFVDGSLHVVTRDPPSISEKSIVPCGIKDVVKVEGAGALTAAEYFVAKRNFKGMDAEVDGSATREVVPGRKGRAAAYSDEPH